MRRHEGTQADHEMKEEKLKDILEKMHTNMLENMLENMQIL